MNLSRWLVPSTALLCVFACNNLVDPDAGAVAPSADAAADAASPIRWELDIADYDQSCQYNGNCRPVMHGPCGDCMCFDAAVNYVDAERYIGDFDAEMRRTQCEVKSGPALTACNELCHKMQIGLCESGRCVVGENQRLDTSGYDRACSTVDDCVGVDAALCDGGFNCSAAIAKSAKAQFEAARAAAPVCGTPTPRVEAAQCSNGEMRCEDGQCTILFDVYP